MFLSNHIQVTMGVKEGKEISNRKSRIILVLTIKKSDEGQ